MYSQVEKANSKGKGIAQAHDVLGEKEKKILKLSLHNFCILKLQFFLKV